MLCNSVGRHPRTNLYTESAVRRLQTLFAEPSTSSISRLVPDAIGSSGFLSLRRSVYLLSICSQGLTADTPHISYFHFQPSLLLTVQRICILNTLTAWSLPYAITVALGLSTVLAVHHIAPRSQGYWFGGCYY